jgi:hypothetical protein
MDSDDSIKPRARAEQTQLLTWRELIGEGLGEEYPRVVDQGVYRAECTEGCFRYSCGGSGFSDIAIYQGQQLN